MIDTVTGTPATITSFGRSITHDVIFIGGDKEVMRITGDGKLIIHDPDEAAKSLLKCWEQYRGD